jgi:hypothetical protein
MDDGIGAAGLDRAERREGARVDRAGLRCAFVLERLAVDLLFHGSDEGVVGVWLEVGQSLAVHAADDGCLAGDSCHAQRDRYGRHHGEAARNRLDENGGDGQHQHAAEPPEERHAAHCSRRSQISLSSRVSAYGI